MRSRCVLFIHGVRHDDSDQLWREAIDRALQRHGTETLESRGYTVVAPSYLDLLDASPAPSGGDVEMTYRKTHDAKYLSAAGGYWAALSSLERCGVRDHEVPADRRSRLPAEGPHVALLMKQLFPQAVAFKESAARRKAIFGRLVDALPRNTDLVIVAHSLGSVVAADLLYYLPPACHLKLLITAGSPLGIGELRGHLDRRKHRFPFEVTGPWLNLVGAEDFVTGYRGLSQHFPEPLDLFIDSGSGRAAHAATGYLDHPSVALALDWLERELDREPATPSSKELDRPLPLELLSIVVGAQYALRLEQAMDSGDQRDRFAQVRGHVLGEMSYALSTAGHDHPIAQRLLLDNAGFLEGRVSHHEAAPLLLAALMTNTVRPYELDLSERAQARALAVLASDLGVTQSWAAKIIDAEKQARDSQRRGKTIKRVAFAAAGLAAIGAMPMLVLAAAPAGLAGGAAIVSGLAALGPGGMLGGIGIVGLLGGAGGALTSQALTAGTAAQVEQNVIYLQTQALATQQLELPVEGHPEWHALAAMEDAAAEDLSKRQIYSDSGAPGTKEAAAKLESIQRALAWSIKQGLAPLQLNPGKR